MDLPTQRCHAFGLAKRPPSPYPAACPTRRGGNIAVCRRQRQDEWPNPIRPRDRYPMRSLLTPPPEKSACPCPANLLVFGIACRRLTRLDDPTVDNMGERACNIDRKSEAHCKSETETKMCCNFIRIEATKRIALLCKRGAARTGI